MSDRETFERAFVAVSSLVGAEAPNIESALGDVTGPAQRLLDQLAATSSSRARASALAAELGYVARHLDRWRIA